MAMSIQEAFQKSQQTGRGFDAQGNPRPLTPREFLDVQIEIGATQQSPSYRALFEDFAVWVVRHLKIRTSLELGAGTGYLLYRLNRLGVDARGIDGNPHSRDFFAAYHPPYVHQYVIDPLFEQTYQPVDAFFSIEVFEHIDDASLETVMTKIRDQLQPRYIVFSSTPHADPNPSWDVQWGHINVKQPEQWHALFARFGFEPVPELKPPVTEWATLYERKGLNHNITYNFSLTPARP